MLLSHFFLPKEKKQITGQVSSRKSYLLRSGMICPVGGTGVAWLPLGWRVVRRVEALLRNEMQCLDALECSIPVTQLSFFQSKKNQDHDNSLKQSSSEGDTGSCFLASHEANMANVIQRTVSSYKQLPLMLFQFQTQYDVEPYLCSDSDPVAEPWVAAYAFHLDETSLCSNRVSVHRMYAHIFEQLGVPYRVMESDHQGQVIHQFYLGADQDGAGGVMVAQSLSWDSNLTQELGAHVLSEQARSIHLYADSYVFNLSRLIDAVTAQYSSDRAMIWPDPIAPFQVMLLPLMWNKSFRVREMADALYQRLSGMGFDVLFDDRSLRPGEMFATADLIGINHCVVISERTIEAGVLEYKHRSGGESLLLTEDKLVAHLSSVFVGRSNKPKIKQGVCGD